MILREYFFFYETLLLLLYMALDKLLDLELVCFCILKLFLKNNICLILFSSLQINFFGVFQIILIY